MKQKYYVELNRQEWRLIIEGLNRFRNKLIAAGRYTDAVDEIFQSRQGKAAEVNVVGMEALMMEKHITDERTGLKYELVGDYSCVHRHRISSGRLLRLSMFPSAVWPLRFFRQFAQAPFSALQESAAPWTAEFSGS